MRDDTKRRLKERLDRTAKEEIAIASDICKKHGASPEHLIIVQMLLMSIGLGRNQQTCSILRAIVDIIECPIEAYEDAEATVRKECNDYSGVPS